MFFIKSKLSADDLRGKRHANVGYDLIKSHFPEKRSGSSEQYLQYCWISHERYDG